MGGLIIGKTLLTFGMNSRLSGVNRRNWKHLQT